MDLINGEWVPLAVSLGIPRDEFYKLNPKKFIRYLPYYEEKAKKDREKHYSTMDIEGWINGVYMSRSIGTMFKKQYPQHPLNLFDLEILRNGDTDENGEEINKNKQNAEGFAGWAYVFNLERHKKLGKEEKSESEVNEDG